jgi:hypothetical protein
VILLINQLSYSFHRKDRVLRIKLVRSITDRSIKGSRFFAAKKGAILIPCISSCEFIPLRVRLKASKIDIAESTHINWQFVC